MINLASASDILRIVTGSAVSTIAIQASWVDNNSSSYSPGRTNTAITTATTTTIVGSPAASTYRNIKGLTVSNNHASSSCVVTIQHYDGTTSIDLMKVTLLAGERLQLGDDGTWRHLTAAGAEYDWAGPAVANLGITGTIAESIPRELCSEANGATLTSGTMHVNLVYLRAGQIVTNISFFSATTAASVPTNQMFALYNRYGNFIERTADDTSTAWAANTIKTLALRSAYTIPVSGFYYICIMVAATAVPTLKGLARGSVITRPFPASNGNTNTGLTATLPEQMNPLPSGAANAAWCAVT